MPYIKGEYREKLDKNLDKIAELIKKINEDVPSQTRDGLLNYSLTRIMNNVYADARYHDFNELIGFLECCKLECYRKRIAPYEDLKESENGVVKTFDLNKRNGY